VVGGVLVAGISWIAMPADAASTGIVSVVSTKVVVYTAAPGKANTVVLTRSGNTITVDDVYGIKAGAGCVKVSGDTTKIRCTPKVAPAWVRVDLSDRNDTVINKSGLSMTAWGRAGNDKITGGPGRDNLYGGEGADAIWGLAGNDQLSGEGGSDALSGGDGLDYITGGAGGDRLLGGNGDDELEGLAGNDVEDGGAGDDVFYQDVQYAAGTDADSFIGGANTVDGADIVVYDYRTKAISADADAVKGDDGAPGEKDTIGGSIEGIVGGDGNDRLIGTARDDVFFGGAGNDFIAASVGDDILFGSIGRDTLNGAGGTDYCPDREAGESVLSCELGGPSTLSAKAKKTQARNADRVERIQSRISANR
jgi:Ca2+-binding RTX toxin-like protein